MEKKGWKKKKLNSYLLTKKVKHKYLIKVRPFSEAKASCMVDNVKQQYEITNQIMLYHVQRHMISRVKKHKGTCKIYYRISNVIYNGCKLSNVVPYQSDF